MRFLLLALILCSCIADSLSLHMEIWRDVDGFSGIYKINVNGDVINVNRGRLVKPNIVKGYKKIKLFLDSKRTYHLVHRLLAIAFIPNPEQKPWINHIDSNPLNNSIGNLEWCTPKENTAHARNKGRFPSRKGIPSSLKGERAFNSRFENAHIPIIKEAIAAGYSLSQIGRYFKTTRGTIWKIKAGYSWRP